MTAGLGLLGLSPAVFWAMSPREFAAAIAAFAPTGSEAIGREGLGQLMRRFPDKPCA